MKVKIVYGSPCSGKSTYAKNNAKDNDVIYDYDSLITAMTSRKEHLVERHAAHFAILRLRQALMNIVKDESNIETVWFTCLWPTEELQKITEGTDVEKILIESTKKECCDRLAKDDTRPDKSAWMELINKWFDEHGHKEGDEKSMKFWNYIKNDAGERVLRLEGPIDSENFWGDEVTPQAFRDELNSGDGDLTVWINSPGGSVFAAAEIYSMLKDYKGKITVKIDALAASAASVIAMAGDKVLISPVALIMIHDPMTSAMGNAKDMEKVITTLNEVKESIINAYRVKTGLSRGKIAQMMEDETWLNAKKAVELGFADEILFEGGEISEEGQSYSTRAMGTAILNRLICSAKVDAGTDDENTRTEDDGEVLESDGKNVEPASPEEQKTEPVEEQTPEEEENRDEDRVTIGLDGKAKDGSMPYELLKKQLDFLI